MLKGENRLSVFQNRLLRRIFKPKRNEATEELTNLCNEETHSLLCSPVIKEIKLKRMIWTRQAAHAEETRSTYKILV
jgi:hypothetical protein